jgi:hypothetical protein
MGIQGLSDERLDGCLQRFGKYQSRLGSRDAVRGHLPLRILYLDRTHMPTRGPGVMRAPAAVLRTLMGEKLFVEDINARVVEVSRSSVDDSKNFPKY